MFVDRRERFFAGLEYADRLFVVEYRSRFVGAAVLRFQRNFVFAGIDFDAAAFGQYLVLGRTRRNVGFGGGQLGRTAVPGQRAQIALDLAAPLQLMHTGVPRRALST